jgi:hypothetical protein
MLKELPIDQFAAETLYSFLETTCDPWLREDNFGRQFVTKVTMDAMFAISCAKYKIIEADDLGTNKATTYGIACPASPLRCDGGLMGKGWPVHRSLVLISIFRIQGLRCCVNLHGFECRLHLPTGELKIFAFSRGIWRENVDLDSFAEVWSKFV